MGVFADVAQGVFGYLYGKYRFPSDSRTAAGGDSPPFASCIGRGLVGLLEVY
jgi:hypothetical protein